MTVDASQGARLRIAILGDPHFVATDSTSSGSSYLKFDGNRILVPADPRQNPWRSLEQLASREDAAREVDMVLCVGDLSTGGDGRALQVGWERLNEFAKLTNAKLLACATGNHDVRTRPDVSKVASNPVRHLADARSINENLKLLEPPFPAVRFDTDNSCADERHARYFGHNLAILEGDYWRLVVLDSCGDHTPNPADYEKGAFLESAQRALGKLLKDDPSPRINILLAHHPPIPHGQGGMGEEDKLSRADELLKMLEEHGSWMIIHGHKHEGKLRWGPSNGNRAPIVLAAASLGAHIEVGGDAYRNQFYVADVHLSQQGQVRGVLRVWDWYNGKGFEPATKLGAGLYDTCGFGSRADTFTVASWIKATFPTPMDWNVVLSKDPDLAYLSPGAMEQLERDLRKIGLAVDTHPYSKLWSRIVKAAS